MKIKRIYIYIYIYIYIMSLQQIMCRKVNCYYFIQPLNTTAIVSS